MEWICEHHQITDDMIKNLEKDLNINFPDDFLSIIKKYDGGYPKPNNITVGGQEEVLNNIVSFIADNQSYIVSIYNDTEGFGKSGLIPVAEDPFGNLFCYKITDGIYSIVFWNHENAESTKFVCNTFTELLQMAHEYREE